MKGLALFLRRAVAIGCCLAFGIAAEEIELKRKWELYEINGRNQSELRRGLNSKGPVNPDSGKRFDARTDWKLEWKYKYETKQGRYRLSSHSIQVTATIHFPKWINMEAGNPLTRRQWLVYIHNLKRHEQGHVELAQRAGQVLSDRLSQLGAFGTRIEIEEAIKKKSSGSHPNPQGTAPRLRSPNQSWQITGSTIPLTPTPFVHAILTRAHI